MAHSLQPYAKRLFATLGSITLPSAVKTDTSIPAISLAYAAADHRPSSRTAALALVLPGGTAQESPETLGASHILKQFYFGSTKRHTGIKLVREAELRGIALSTAVGREYIALIAECLNEETPFAIRLLSEVALNTKFPEWQLESARKSAYDESRAAFANRKTLIVERLYRVAFRQNGLGNSIYASPENSTTNYASLNRFQEKISQYKPVIAGIGVAKEFQETVRNVFEKLETGLGTVDPRESTYFGGERRADDRGENSIGLAFPVTSQHAAAGAVLRHFLGSGEKYIRWGQGVSPIRSLNVDGVELSTFYHTYSTQGLFGVFASGLDADAVGKRFKAAVTALKSVAQGKGLTEEQITRAKNRALAAFEESVERPAEAVVELATQMANNQCLDPFHSIPEAIRKVTENDIVGVAKSMMSQRPSFVVLGQEALLPHWEDIVS